jgi:magnesium-transporting ATPase (P-type)
LAPPFLDQGTKGRRPAVSKRTSTRGYIVAWVIYVVAFAAFFMMMHNSVSGGASSPPPISLAFFLVLFASAIATWVCWIGALIRLGQIKAWGWFVAVLVLHVVGLGIAGMVAYAIAGPEDSMTVVMRPPTAT